MLTVMDWTTSKEKFFEFVSFSDRKIRIFSFALVLFLLFLIPVNFLENSPNISICYHILGEYCYSYGLTRGIASLLKGNIELALQYNKLSILVLIIIILIIISDFIGLKKKKS